MRFTPTSTLAIVLVTVLSATSAAQTFPPSSIYPDWSTVKPNRTIRLNHDGALSDDQNGAVLKAAIYALVAGDELRVGPGRFSVNSFMILELQGTATAPIVVTADDLSNKPILTRPNANQNALNIGSLSTEARYLCFRGFEITGGAGLCRLLMANNVWVDHCHMHDGSGTGVSANTVNSSHLYITNNEISNPGPGKTGEAMYIGSNDGKVTTHHTVIANNHVHSTGLALQGDGIELKQNSHHVWIVGNHVHDTKYPCILVYGTGGNGINIVENNFCYRSQENVIQAQGEAIVRNNVAIGGFWAFGSHDHAAQSTDLQVLHNTFINTGTAVDLNSWNSRSGMVFANNICYSQTGDAIKFGRGSAGVTMAGNIVLGNVVSASSGFLPGVGISDFVNASFDGSKLDSMPTSGGAIDNRGDRDFLFASDLRGVPRELPVDPGAITNGVSGIGSLAELNANQGGTQTLLYSCGAPHAGHEYIMLGSITGTKPGERLNGYEVPLIYDAWFDYTVFNPTSPFYANARGFLDAQGKAVVTLTLPPLPFLKGITMHHAVVIIDGGSLAYASNPVPLKLN